MNRIYWRTNLEQIKKTLPTSDSLLTTFREISTVHQRNFAIFIPWKIPHKMEKVNQRENLAFLPFDHTVSLSSLVCLSTVWGIWFRPTQHSNWIIASIGRRLSPDSRVCFHTASTVPGPAFDLRAVMVKWLWLVGIELSCGKGIPTSDQS